MNLIKHLAFLLYLTSGRFLAMDKVNVAPANVHSQALEIVSLPQGFYQLLPPDLKQLLLVYILARETISSVFPRIGELREVSKEWQIFLYNPQFLRHVFKVCQYPEAVHKNPAVLDCLRSYIVSLVVKKERLPFERNLIHMLRQDIWDINAILVRLMSLPHSTITTLRTNHELLQAIVGFYLLVLSPQGTPPGEASKVTDQSYYQCKLREIVTDKRCTLSLVNSLASVIEEIAKPLTQDQITQFYSELVFVRLV